MPLEPQYAVRAAIASRSSIVPAGFDGLATIRPSIGPPAATAVSISSGVGWKRSSASARSRTGSMPNADRVCR